MGYKNPEKKRAYERAYYARHAEGLNARRKAILARDPSKRKDYVLRSLYGISRVDYDSLYLRQGGVCAICRRPETMVDKRTGKTQGLSVDHNHKTGKVRGLLCGVCNTGLGKFKEDPRLLRLAADYLEDR